MTEIDMVKIMFEKQDELNTHTNGENWKNLNIAWFRAIWAECAEMLDYTPWKWWKKGQLNYDQIKLELIDIWHFGMSDILMRRGSSDEIMTLYRHVVESFKSTKKINKKSIQELIEELASHTLLRNAFPLHSFLNLVVFLDMDIRDMFILYMGKNVLNKFRQNFGYKEGTYIKDWNGKEDNDYMMEIIYANIEKVQNNFENFIYDKLKEQYVLIDSNY